MPPRQLEDESSRLKKLLVGQMPFVADKRDAARTCRPDCRSGQRPAPSSTRIAKMATA